MERGVKYKMSETKSSKVLTTGFGIPVGDDQNSLIAGGMAAFLCRMFICLINLVISTMNVFLSV